MSSSMGPSQAQLKRILSRQATLRYGAAYQPAMRAVREEAPSLSRFQEIWFHLHDRYIQTFSTWERKVVHVLLYCTWLVDLLEQRMLPYLPAPHPLQEHPAMRSQPLPRFRGTLAVADELGALNFHPTVNITRPGAEAEEAPYPYLGDLLAVFKDERGLFCVNISVKESAEDFEMPSVGVKAATDMKRAAIAERLRHQIEAALYRDVGIPTIQVAGDELHKVMVANLEQIYGWMKREHPFDEPERQDILRRFREALLAQMAPLEVIHHLIVERSYSAEHVKAVMYQAIWRRELRVDLYQFFFTDRPMVRERRDVLVEHASWFRRSEA